MNKTVRMPSTTHLEEIVRQGYYFTIRLPYEDHGTYASIQDAKYWLSRMSPRQTENGVQIIRITLR
jgi:hypothetical protein